MGSSMRSTATMTPGEIWFLPMHWGSEVAVVLSHPTPSFDGDRVRVVPVRAAFSSVRATGADFVLPSENLLFGEEMLAACWNIRFVPTELFDGGYRIDSVDERTLTSLLRFAERVLFGEFSSEQHYAMLDDDERAEMRRMAVQWDDAAQLLVHGQTKSESALTRRSGILLYPTESEEVSVCWNYSQRRMTYFAEGGLRLYYHVHQQETLQGIVLEPEIEDLRSEARLYAEILKRTAALVTREWITLPAVIDGDDIEVASYASH